MNTTKAAKNGLYFFKYFSMRLASYYKRIYIYIIIKTTMRLTNTEVEIQKQRFEHFYNTANLIKIGRKICEFHVKDNGDGRYNAYCYVLRVLRLLAGVSGCMIHPDNGTFYNAIIERNALKSYLNTFK